MADMQIVLASSCKNVEAQHVEMMVPLYSHGCEKKVKKTLSHLKGIYSVNVDYYQQKVTVWGICNKQDVLATIKTKRKEARFWNPQDSTQMEESPPPPPPPPPPPKYSNRTVPSLTLMKARSLTRSLSLKVWKKVFTRTNSF
ncbi:HEAVY METAL TRANSPORT/DETOXIFICATION SUPERFAMILY PROTEIN [Salix viminalis]|uniref:HEAVY METAL TRANSPORT/DETOXIFICATION SUPERFAMILY PROTEIN n=1 Tax=Salix viminalis TaxID=40686 RepID=A0A6N2LL43_SALVM|nr:HEAVY METAL TRANSPORT/DETOXIFICATION SUPERFAMILY PROTEIN [Salix viminalis]